MLSGNHDDATPAEPIHPIDYKETLASPLHQRGDSMQHGAWVLANRTGWAVKH